MTITYALSNNSGGHFALNSSTGMLTVSGTLDQGTYEATVTASNSETGSVSTTDFALEVGAAVVVPGMTFTRQSSATWLGQSVEFRDNEVYASGSPAQALVAYAPDGQILIKPEAGIWAFVSTPSDLVSLTISSSATIRRNMAGIDTVGAVSGVMVRRNGLMKNPMLYDETLGQGFDERLSYFGGAGMTGPKQGAVSRYNPALNRHHLVTGVGIPLTESGSYIQSIAGTYWDAAMTTNLPWEMFNLWWGFHILDAGHNPKIGSFAPSIFTTGKICEYRIGETHKDILSGVSLQTGLSDIATLEAEPQATKYMPDGIPPFFNTSGERRRRMIVTTATPGIGGYSGNFGYGVRMAQWHAALDAAGSGISDAIWAKAIGLSLHFINLATDPGPKWGGGAGQSTGHWGFVPFARFAFRDRTDIEAKARAAKGNEVDQSIVVGSNLVGNVTVSIGRYIDATAARTNHGNIHQPYYPEQSGIMDFNATAGSNGVLNADTNADFEADYRTTAAYGVFPTLINAANYRHGPGGMTGAQWMLADGPFDSTNTAATARALGYIERAARWKNDALLTKFTIDPMLQRFKDTRASWGVDPYGYKPDALTPYPGDQASFLTFTSGGFSLDVRDLVTSALPIVEYGCRYSQDGNSWKTVSNSTGQFAVSGLPLGCYLYVQYRGRNTLGWGRWSTNLPSHYENANSLLTTKRMVGRTTGTATGTTVFDAALPARVGIPFYPLWGPFDIRPVSEIPVDLVVHDTLYPLLGWIDGTVPDGATIEWRRGSTLLATGVHPYNGYPIRAADLGTSDIFVRVIRNGVTSDSVTVAIPARTTQPASLVFELHPNIEFYYPAVMASLRASSVSVSGVDMTRYAIESKDEAGETIYGSPIFTLRGLKSGQAGATGGLKGNFAADFPLVPGRTYRVQGAFPIGYGRFAQQAGRTVSFTAGPVLDSAAWASQSYVTSAAPNDKYVMPIDFTFTPTTGQTALFMRFNTNSNNAGVNGGDPMASMLKVIDVTP